MFETIAALLTEGVKAIWELLGIIAYYCADSFWE